MRKHLHTALVILCLLASAASGQFSEIWTNGDLFAVNEMASQCYSASVERCQAAGVTPNSPSWFDYLLGKNHAKLASVKANIAAARPYFVNPRTNALDLLIAHNTAAWTNDIHFLADCALPTNAISETPWFKSQYHDTTGGWVHCWLMLTNMAISQGVVIYTNPVGTTNSAIWAGIGYAPDYRTNNWTDAKSASEDTFVYEDSVGYGTPMRFTLGYLDLAGYAAYGYNEFYLAGYANTSGIYRTSILYTKGSVIDDLGIFGYTTNEFSAQGMSVTNGWSQIGSIGATNANYITGIEVSPIGDLDTNPTFPPDWCQEPTIQDDTFQSAMAKGFMVIDEKWTHNWTATTNGFKYR